MNANELAEILKENPTFIASLQNKVEQQELEIEQLKHKLSIEKSRLNLNIQAISKIKEQAKEIDALKEVLKIIFKHRIEQEKLIYELYKKNEELIIENEVLRANLQDVANQLRIGVSKIQQKTMAKVIEDCFGEKK